MDEVHSRIMGLFDSGATGRDGAPLGWDEEEEAAEALAFIERFGGGVR